MLAKGHTVDFNSVSCCLFHSQGFSVKLFPTANIKLVGKMSSKSVRKEATLNSKHFFKSQRFVMLFDLTLSLEIVDSTSRT